MFKNTRVYFIICLLVLFQYGNTFEHDYAWDDAIVITQNERVQQGLSKPLDFFRNIKGDETQYRYGYRPISLLSFAVDIELSEMTPKTGHVMNVLYYALLCCLIFYFLRRMFPEKSALFALIVVGLFVIHPIHTEVVANIKSRDEILAMIFGVLSLLFFLNFLEKPKRNFLFGGLTLVALILSFLSKENGIVFVPILLIVAYFKQSEHIKPYFKFSLVVFGGIVLFAIRAYVYSDAVFENNATALLESSQYKEDGFLGNPLFDAKGLKEIIPNVFNILIKDIGLLLFPITLVHDYGFSHSTIVSWVNPLVIFSILLHLGLIYVVIREFKKKSALLFGILFYFAALSVYLHILQIGPDYMGERFLFIPSLGFLIAIVALIERLTGASFNVDAEPVWKNGKAKIAFGVIALFFLMGFTKTINRNKAWENNTTLYEADIIALDDCARTQYNYACLLHANYYNSPSKLKQEKILYHYNRAVHISDRSMKPMLDLGNAYMEFGNFDKGKETFLKTIDSHPRVAPPLIQLGKYYLAQNNFELALETYRRAKDISETSEVNYSIAYCLMKLNKIDQAIEILENSEKLAQNDFKNFELLSILRILKKEYKLALDSIEKALKISPNNESLLKNRDWILDNIKSQK
jgi:tetratricopeptide (TPR) repeat protein